MAENESESKRFTPKVPVQLDPPKDDPISPEELAKCDGKFYLGSFLKSSSSSASRHRSQPPDSRRYQGHCLRRDP